jgi:ketosteroid isomerase-like protein
MSHSDVERLRAAYEALERGDLSSVLELIDPEAELLDRPELPDPRTYHGHEGLRASIAESVAAFEDFHFVPERFFDAGEKVVVILKMSGRGRASGVPVEERIAHLWTIAGGRAIRLQAFTDPAEALEAAGLSPE